MMGWALGRGDRSSALTKMICMRMIIAVALVPYSVNLCTCCS